MSNLALVEPIDLDEYEGEPLVEFTDPQADFYFAPEAYPLFVGGYGSGKSTTMTACVVSDLVTFRGADIGCYAPSYDLLKLITEPYLADYLTKANLQYTFNKSDHIFTVQGYGRIICRSLMNPERIVGYEVFRSHVDELDTLRPALASEAWKRVIARNRQKLYVYDEDGKRVLREDWEDLPEDESIYATAPNRVFAYTTPEGFLFAYERWVKGASDEYRHYSVSTYSNRKNLPAGYIENLEASYPLEYISAYLEGKFVNLTSGRVYTSYDRELNRSYDVADDTETVYVGVDFNVMYGAALAHVLRYEEDKKGNSVEQLHAIGEVHNSYDTDATIAALRDMFPNNPIHVYPDATGDRRSASNSAPNKTDIAKLKLAGFKVIVDSKNPAIRERVQCTNAVFCTGTMARRYYINDDLCPEAAAAFEQQVYDKNGQPDKTSGNDHITECGGYVCAKRYPIAHVRAGYLKPTQRRVRR